MRRDMLAILSDGQFHSGEALGLALGVSRMAIWKRIRALRECGVPLDVVRARGYRLPAAVELLDARAIQDGLGTAARDRLASVDTFLEIDSTNTWLRQRALEGAPSGSVCVAEMQSAGRGRRNRHWVSPFAASLYLSLLWRSSAGAAELGGLSLAAGVAIVRSLRDFWYRYGGTEVAERRSGRWRQTGGNIDRRDRRVDGTVFRDHRHRHQRGHAGDGGRAD